MAHLDKGNLGGAALDWAGIPRHLAACTAEWHAVVPLILLGLVFLIRLGLLSLVVFARSHCMFLLILYHSGGITSRHLAEASPSALILSTALYTSGTANAKCPKPEPTSYESCGSKWCARQYVMQPKTPDVSCKTINTPSTLPCHSCMSAPGCRCHKMLVRVYTQQPHHCARE